MHHFFELIKEFVNNLNPILGMGILTLTPFLELRASIPYGIFMPNSVISWWGVSLLCMFFNLLLAPLTFFFFDKVIHLFRFIKFIDKLYIWFENRVQKKTQHFVDKYGEIGLGLFIGVPLPGSGVYSGSLAAVVFKMKFKDYMIASLIGVLIAGTVVTLICVGGLESIEIVKKLFLKTI